MYSAGVLSDADRWSSHTSRQGLSARSPGRSRKAERLGEAVVVSGKKTVGGFSFFSLVV